MKKFGKYIALLFGILFSSCILLQYVYQKHFTNHPAKNKLEAMMRLKDVHYDIVFIGSSRVEMHIDCKRITEVTGKSCANFSYQGLLLLDIEALVAFFEKNNVTYDHGYIQVDYSYMYQRHSVQYQAAVVPYLDWDMVENSLIESSRKNTILKIPFMGYIMNDIRYNVRQISSDILSKRSPEEYTYDLVAWEGMNTRRILDFPEVFNRDNASFDRLLETKVFKEKRLDFFTSPFCPNVKNRGYHKKLVDEFSFIKDYTLIFDDNLRVYRDCGHLNKEGAQLFTEHIIANLLIEN